MPCSWRLCQPCSPFGRLAPPHPAHGNHPTLQHPSRTHGAHARLSEPIPGLHHLCQAHSTCVLLTARLAGSQYSHHALYCSGQSHSTHPSLTAPMHPSHAHSTHPTLASPISSSQYPCQARGTHPTLTAPMPGSQGLCQVCATCITAPCHACGTHGNLTAATPVP